MSASYLASGDERPLLDRSREALGLSRKRLAALVAGRVEPDGAIRGRCQSRALESALLLQLLRKQTTAHREQAGLAEYLRRVPDPSPLDQLVIDGALGRANHRAAADYLTRFRHATGDRKRLVMAALTTLCGAAPFDPAMDPERLHYSGQAAWTDLTLCAIRILYRHARTHPDPAPRPGTAAGEVEDRLLLIRYLEAFGPGRVWQGNALAHLIALHALHTWEPSGALMKDGTDVLLSLRNPDGGVPFIAGQEVWATALAGTALAEAGAPSGLLTRMGGYLSHRQLADGGWGYDETTTQSDVDDTSRCAQFLRLADPTGYHRAMESVEDYLTAIADPRGGGFPTYLKGHPSEPDLTAGAVIALAPAGRRHTAVLTAATEYLLDAQQPDGGFERSWTLSHTSVLSHVLDAFHHVLPLVPALSHPIGDAIDRSVAHLRTTQNGDGGWGQTPGTDSDTLASAHATAALARTLTSTSASKEAMDRAVGHLLSRQNHDGGFTALPDQVGPRPIPYDFPVLTDIITLTALNEACAYA